MNPKWSGRPRDAHELLAREAMSVIHDAVDTPCETRCQQPAAGALPKIRMGVVECHLKPQGYILGLSQYPPLMVQRRRRTDSVASSIKEPGWDAAAHAVCASREYARFV